MRKILTSFFLMLVAMTAMAQEGRKYGEAEQYRRSSLSLILISHGGKKYAQQIEQQFYQIVPPERYNEHRISVRVIPASGKMSSKKIDALLRKKGVAKELVNTWFNRSYSTGVCNMNLIQERGLYNASKEDNDIAQMTQRKDAMLKDAGFLVKDIDMKAYMAARSMTQSFIDDFLGYWIDPRNRYINSLMLGSGLPGGMMGSLMADLKGAHALINMNYKAQGKAELSEDELLVELFDEVQRIWPMVGNPPLVTPFSQYTKNIALKNLIGRSMGKPDFSDLDEAMWGMILGKSGKLPGTLAPEIVELAKEQKREFFTGNPQDEYPNELPRFIEDMKKEGWDRGQDDEELFEFAMHEKQYREYKSGEAKRRFNQELEAKMKAKFEKAGGEAKIPDLRALRHPNAEPVVAPVSGVVLWEVDFDDKSIAPAPGTVYKEGDLLCAIQTNLGLEPVYALWPGKIVEATADQGKRVNKGETIAFIEK